MSTPDTTIPDTNALKCCYCLRPIHKDDARDYLGDRLGHKGKSRCIQLLDAEIRTLKEDRDSWRRVAEKLEGEKVALTAMLAVKPSAMEYADHPMAPHVS